MNALLQQKRFVLAVLFSALVVACSAIWGFDDLELGPSDQSSSSSGQPGGPDTGSSGAPSNNCVPPTAVEILPASTNHTVEPGMAYSLPFTAQADGKDVTADVSFNVSDANVGTFTGATFTWGGNYGGALMVSAKYCGVVGTTTLNLKLKAPPLLAGDGATGLPSDFAAAPSASQSQGCKPTLKYPPDQVLLPPNTNVLEVHFLIGSSPAVNTKFEVAFTNAVTDVRIYTTCSAPPLGSGAPDVAKGAAVTGGCLLELSQQAWDYIANSNRDGTSLAVTVRGLGCDSDPTHAGQSDARSISFAHADVTGTVYYFAASLGAQNLGGIFRADYGRRGQAAEAVLSPLADAKGNGGNTNLLCVGCHAVDLEGRKLAFSYDDNDNDDGYDDQWTDAWDIPSKTASWPIVKPAAKMYSAGWRTWSRSASSFLKSDGRGDGQAGLGADAGVNGTKGTFHVVDSTGTPIGKTTPNLTSLRGTTPDISPDETKVVFAAMADQQGGPTTPGYYGPPDVNSDQWFNGAGLYVASWDPATKTLGTATPIFPAAAGTTTDPPSYYYPSWSPDGSFIAFNKSSTGGNFHNPKARFFLVTANGTLAAEQHKANETNPVEGTGELTNSWVRWLPFIQEYKGKKLAWVTFSSTRNYGLRIDNSANSNCWPAENPNSTTYRVFTGTNCARTQLWMAAVDLDTGTVATGGDVSHAAFWVPFQDMSTNNHLGQWTQKSFKGTCTSQVPCATGFVCDDGACAAIPPANKTPPNPAECTSSVQCAPATCCVAGTCDVCGDAGAPAKACNTCLDCAGKACVGGTCGDCKSSSECCAPLVCSQGSCIKPVN